MIFCFNNCSNVLAKTQLCLICVRYPFCEIVKIYIKGVNIVPWITSHRDDLRETEVNTMMTLDIPDFVIVRKKTICPEKLASLPKEQKLAKS